MSRRYVIRFFLKQACQIMKQSSHFFFFFGSAVSKELHKENGKIFLTWQAHGLLRSLILKPGHLPRTGEILN